MLSISLSVSLSKMRNEKHPLNLMTEPLVASLTTGWLGQWGWKAEVDGLRGEKMERSTDNSLMKFGS